MNKMVKRLIKAWDMLAVEVKLFMNPRAIVLVCTPVHGNLGDSAITAAEYEFLNKYFPDKKVIEISSPQVRRSPFLLNFINAEQLVLVHGGGFLGTIWMSEEENFETVIQRCMENSVIVMPQTVFFEETDHGRDALERFKTILGNHPDLTVVLREDNSREFFDKQLPEIKHIMVPDMVTYPDYSERAEKSNKVCLCLRGDWEKVLDDSMKQRILDVIAREMPNAEVEITDTVIDLDVKPGMREEKVREKIRQFAGARLVVTDRLHGMVFAAHAGTHCIVLDNSSHKVEGVYRYLKHNKYLQYVDDPSRVEEAVHTALAVADGDCSFDRTPLTRKFDQLAELIRSKVN